MKDLFHGRIRQMLTSLTQLQNRISSYPINHASEDIHWQTDGHACITSLRGITAKGSSSLVPSTRLRTLLIIRGVDRGLGTREADKWGPRLHDYDDRPGRVRYRWHVHENCGPPRSSCVHTGYTCTICLF